MNMNFGISNGSSAAMSLASFPGLPSLVRVGLGTRLMLIYMRVLIIIMRSYTFGAGTRYLHVHKHHDTRHVCFFS